MRIVRIAGLAMVTLLAARAASDVVVYISAIKSIGPAEQVAASIFAGAGITVTWHRGEPAAGAPGSVVVRVDLSEDTPADCPLETLAVAHPYAGADKGITVFYKKLRQMAGTVVPEQLLLGHVLAHEIGHVLEGQVRHSQEGVMKAHWSYKDLCGMQDAPLRFAPEDLEMLRRGLEWHNSLARSFVH
jgi:hypothetical protein